MTLLLEQPSCCWTCCRSTGAEACSFSLYPDSHRGPTTNHPPHTLKLPSRAAAQVMDVCSFMAARLVSPVFFSFFHSGCLIFMFLYLWSKQSPEAQVSLYGFIKLQGACSHLLASCSHRRVPLLQLKPATC